MKKKTLIIDDLPETKNVFADCVATTYREGIEALQNDGPFSIVYLDHDLGDYDEGVEKTGYDIMCFLEQNLQLLPEKIVCVSRNPVGRAKIQAVIDKLYRRNNEDL